MRIRPSSEEHWWRPSFPAARNAGPAEPQFRPDERSDSTTSPIAGRETTPARGSAGAVAVGATHAEGGWHASFSMPRGDDRSRHVKVIPLLESGCWNSGPGSCGPVFTEWEDLR